jgi:tetratricopeptide (TPR) repeat protein
MNIPYKAAVIMEERLGQNIIKVNEKNLDTLGDLYYESKEFKKAIEWYEKAAKLSEKGKIYFKIAQIYENERNYEEVVKNAKLSLEKADENRLGEKHFLLAKAQYELGNMQEAKEGFTEALKYPKIKKSAQAWLEYIKENNRS